MSMQKITVTSFKEKMEKARYMKRDTKENIKFYIMMAIPLTLILIFCYLPMFGLIMAFQNYIAGRPFIGEGVEWVGLKWFKQFVTSYYFPRIIRNTIKINIMGFFLGFWVPICFAIVLSEVKNSKLRKFTQTVSYMPNFISSVVVAGMVLSFIANDGIITLLLNSIGLEVKSLNASKPAFPWILVLTNVWKGFGWSSILYLSTITSIDPQLYEAAAVDGAGRIRRIWHITIPSMMPLITIQLIMTAGSILGSDSDMILLLYNSAVYETADVIGTYIYRESLLNGAYSYGTACGLILSLMSFTLVWCANAVCRKYTDYSMW